ncbi:MAG: translation initiation factor IF-2 subunit gamma [Candidatus Pacearchaeota archaeon]
MDDKNLSQPDINIGLVGHIDHGKTTLLWRLSGKWADVHSEELKRGITIKLGYANVIIRKCTSCGYLSYHKKCPKCNSSTNALRHVSFIDAPGHKMLMAAMLGGATVIDAAILVIAANEPFPQPQTKEHFLALKSNGIKDIIIAQNKIDLVTKEEAIKQYYQIKEFFEKENMKPIIIPCSAQQDINIDLILEEILKLPKPQRDLNEDPLFLVVRSFDVNKPGTDIDNIKGGVLGGTLKKGILKVGDEIEIKPGLSIVKQTKQGKVVEYKTLTAKILELKTDIYSLNKALPYGNLAIQTSLDPGLTKADSLAGCVVGLKGKLPDITYKVKLKIYLFERLVGTKEEEIIQELKLNENLLLSINTSITVGKIINIKKEKDYFIVDCDLTIPIVPIKNSKVSIARNYKGEWRLIGYGGIL